MYKAPKWTGLKMQWFKDWREEVELLPDTVLSHIKESGNQTQICKSMGWKRGKNISEYSL